MAPSLSSSSSAATTSVQVALRIRPTTSADTASIPARFQRTVIHAASSTSVSVDATPAAPPTAGSATASAPTASSGAPAKKQVFTFDQVHPPATTQHALFTSTAHPLISRFLEGFNCTILAYGQTSSGKTFTMTGIDLDADPSDPNNGMGIIPRAVSTIFQRAHKIKEERGAAWSYSIKGSFIEIYNEDLIDLLSLDDTVGGRREVQIREDKDGHIIWGGLREISVKNSGEVMNLIRKGTSIRRTNETDMNAQSSRSHAIFSLTLTQKKFTGSGLPPRSSSPLPPGGRSPSRLARPGSMYTHPVGGSARGPSPTFGRPATPSFAVAMGRGGMRPASSMGLRAPEKHTGGDDDAGEWVTVVSKFHFVDLAGSERLKRTAAAGERIKEGISINSGLLALGNVISALGDPARAKSHTATHVPYRDSKLTRLLQDSLGGNAHTLMIACVSPAEWNAGETVNTLKYANRARNIKNRAVVNEKEDGWDDVEWLQGMVTRLRKEVKQIKENGGVPTAVGVSEPLEGAGKKVLAQMTDLQNNYEDLREKYVERTGELTRLRRELGEKHRTSSAGAIGGTAKYEEIVGPVIEEYEKTISAMEAELSLNRAALRHTNEMVEEKEEELTMITERHSATELYVGELRTRVAKLTEREASTEAYVRDLEEKIKGYDETSISSSESMTDLKREISRYRDAESYSSKYIADLETRLARSDESVLSLQQTIEHLESASERRRDEVEVLQSRLENLKRDGDSWRTDLEVREKKVRELEIKMEGWEQKKKEAGEDRLRLGNVVGEVAQARKSLEDFNPKAGSGSSDGMPSGFATPNGNNVALETQLLALQETHTATLADLSSVTIKYRDALREISDLAAQIQEAKLSNPTVLESPAAEKAMEIPPFRRRMTGPRSRESTDSQGSNSGKRLFHARQAVSTESLHARSLSQSQSLSQELSSARLRKASISSHGTSSSVSHSPSQSYSRPNLSISLPGLNGERSVNSLEKEIMRLQEVLKEREAEISALEGSLKEKDSQLGASSNASSPADTNGHLDTHLSPQTMGRFEAIRKIMEHDAPEGAITPDSDDSLIRLNELMLSMAQKESAHREVLDDLNSQLSQVRRQYDDLTMLSRDQAVNMSAELEALRCKHNGDLATLEQVKKHEAELVAALEQAETAHTFTVERLRGEHEEALHAKEAEVDVLLTRMKEEHEASLNGLRDELASASAALEKAHQEHQDAFGKLKSEHEEELQHRIQEANDLLAKIQQEHEATLTEANVVHEGTLKKKEEEASTILQHTEEEYYEALTKLRNDHQAALDKQSAEAAVTLQRLREEHAGELRMAEIAREGSLSESQSARAVALRELQDEHAAAIARKEAAIAEELENLKTQHVQALANKDSDHSGKLERLRAKQTLALATTEEEHETELSKLRLQHSAVLGKLQDESAAEIERLSTALMKSQEDATTSSVKAREEMEAAIQKLQEQQASILHEVERGHEADVSKRTNAHEEALKDAISKAEAERASLVQSHIEETLKLRAGHQEAISAAQAELVAVEERHQQELEELRRQISEVLDQERAEAAATLAELEQQHAGERDTLRKDHDLLVMELESHKTVAGKSVEERVRLAAENERLTTEMKQKYGAEVAALREGHDSLAQELDSQKAVAISLVQERDKLSSSLTEIQQKHAAEQDAKGKEHDLLVQELESYKAAADEYSVAREELREAHENTLNQKASIIADMERELSSAHSERDQWEAEVAKLRAQLDKTRSEQSKLIEEASKRDSIVSELEKHRSVLAEVQENLQRVKDEKDVIQAEKSRQDSTLRELQTQIARISSHQENVPNGRPVPDRNLSYTRATGLPAMKLPPPTPPPSVPPPPAPMGPSHSNGDTAFSPSTQSSTVLSSSSSRESVPESPSTSVANSVAPGVNGSAVDPKSTTQLEQQAKQIDEQEVMIKTLNKQLMHCETDLQAHMDLVNNLETSLGDSEKNLRKARMQATELARERDTLSGQIESLRNELQEAKREVVTVRRSIVEEKQSLEHRLDEERRAKERARQQLDSRMDDFQKRKSKFACL